MLDVKLKVFPNKLLIGDERFLNIRFPLVEETDIFMWPLIGLEEGKKVRVVGNVEMLKLSESEEMGVYVITEMNPMLILKILCHYYENQRPLNLVEKSNILNLGQFLDLSLVDLAKEICPLLELPPKRESVKDLLFIQKIPLVLKEFIVEKSMGLKQAVVFQRCGDNFYWVVLLVEKGKVSLGVLVEIINTVWEISQRDNKTIGEVLDETEIDRSLTRESIPAIRQLLWQKRFPILSETNRSIEAVVQNLSSPKGVNISWDRTFEKEGIEIRIDAKTGQDYIDIVKWMINTDMSEIFEKSNYSGY